MSNTTKPARKARLPVRLKGIITANLKRFTAALASISVESAELTYDGGGDEGKVQSVDFTGGNGGEDTAQVTIIDRAWTKEGTVPVEKTVNLDDALEVIWNQIMERHDHENYDNGEGGFGTLTINVADCKYTLEHNTRFVDSEEHVYAG